MHGFGRYGTLMAAFMRALGLILRCTAKAPTFANGNVYEGSGQMMRSTGSGFSNT